MPRSGYNILFFPFDSPLGPLGEALPCRGPSKGEACMFTIGEFSKVAGLTVKTLRFYHEEGLLLPSFVDPRSGYL
jgi:hypothetical protein